jgi:hypothetical protein
VGTVRRECLDRILASDQRQLHRVVVEFVEHYNGHRPHRALGQWSPVHSESTPPTRSDDAPDPTNIRRIHKLGGLVHEY